MLVKQANEIIKCAESFPYFCKNYIKYQHPLRGLLPFELSSWQLRLAAELEENRFVISKKWRQGGISTVHMLYCLHQCMFREKKRIIWICKSKGEAENWSEMFNLSIQLLPTWMQPRMERNNLREKTFAATGSDIIFSIPQAARGRACTHLVIDEAAFIPRMEWHWKVMWPCLSTGGRCYVTSTVNYGKHGLWFTELYLGAVGNKNCFHVYESNYLEHPDYQKPEVLQAVREALGEEGWDQEIEALLFRAPKEKVLETEEKDPTTI
jgi:hypothetical protein